MRKLIIGTLTVLVCIAAHASDAKKAPNILLVLTDDQGWGDLSCHGNPDLKTPHIDRFSEQSIELTRFYVSPVCAPTRASLMTGRYNYRTGVTDTWFGRATLATEETTLAEALKAAGYTTGLFGKWHLGDNAPYRPEDQGFDEVLMHRGGGIAQPSCPPGNSYFDPLLLHNGVMKKFSGYCMDVYTDATIRFIETHKGKPFFAYLATNTPHSPLQVPDRYADPYRKKGLEEDTAKVYGMVANIDDNFGRLMSKLEELGLADNTIVIFMSDNGPKINTSDRYNGTFRGEKTEVYEGGVRVPFFIRWPTYLKSGKKIDTMAAHIDLMPTLLAACGAPFPSNVEFDGINLMPLLKNPQEELPNRTLFLQWHRGNEPSEYQNFTAISQRYKLIQNRNRFDTRQPEKFELYDLESDPEESSDVAEEYPERISQMKQAYDAWFADVCKNGFAPSPVWIGTDHENPVILTQQERRDATKWGDDQYFPEAYWPIQVVCPGTFTATLRLFTPTEEKGTAILKAGNRTFKTRVNQGVDSIQIKNVELIEEDTSITAWIEFKDRKIAPQFLDIKF